MHATRHFGPAARRGFTLIELLAVMGIIIVLLGLVMGLASVASKNAAISKAQADIQKLAQAVEDRKLDTGAYPTSLPLSLTDPWNNAYQYTLQGKSYLILSMGPDGRTGQTDGDADGKWDNIDDISNRKSF